MKVSEREKAPFVPEKEGIHRDEDTYSSTDDLRPHACSSPWACYWPHGASYIPFSCSPMVIIRVLLSLLLLLLLV